MSTRPIFGPAWQENDLVFCGLKGQPIHGNNLGKQYRTICERAEVPHITVHGIRHTVASHLIASGWDVTEVAYQLGHSRPSITSDIYSHVLPHRKKELGRAIGQLLLGGGGPVASNR
jgi:integrase